MKYTIHHFRKDYPTDSICLDAIFKGQYPGLKGYYRIKGRKSYANAAGQQLHPLKGTIFEKSSTPLTVWFEALYLFSIAKNGVSAKELQRHFGVTYKCAWRMAYQIRKLMEQDREPLQGVVETDQAYMLPRKKIPVAGAVARGGKAKTKTISRFSDKEITDFMVGNISRKAELMTDAAGVYNNKRFPNRQQINKSREGHARGIVHVNTIEGFWAQVKRSINGTYHYISPKHAQHYLDEFSFRYSYRDSSVPIFSLLVERASGR